MTEGERSVSLLRSRVNLNREGDYWVASHVSDASPERLRADKAVYPRWVAERYLQLPDTVPFAVRDLAAKITTAYDNPYDKAEAIELVLRTYPYNQGIAAPPPGADAVDYFLNDVKEGYCDYYASAMVVMLRSVGIPARFAVGYTPGKEVPQQAQDESELIQYRVQENNAHAWPEVFFPSYGWVQFEPTASEPLLVRPADAPAAPLDAGLQPQMPPNPGRERGHPPGFRSARQLAARTDARRLHGLARPQLGLVGRSDSVARAGGGRHLAAATAPARLLPGL